MTTKGILGKKVGMTQVFTEWKSGQWLHPAAENCFLSDAEAERPQG